MKEAIGKKLKLEDGSLAEILDVVTGDRIMVKTPGGGYAETDHFHRYYLVYAPGKGYGYCDTKFFIQTNPGLYEMQQSLLDLCQDFM